MKFVIRNILFLFNLVFILGLILSYVSPFVNPSVFYPIGLFGLTFKFWLLANFGLFLLWVMLGRKLWLYNFVVLLLGFQIIQRDVQVNTPSSKEGNLHTLFFNTRVQQVYNDGNTSAEINEYVSKEDVDIADYHHSCKPATI